MDTMRRILLVGSQHGDELIGEQLYVVIKDKFAYLLPQVDYVLANPKAYEQKVRYIETDMNRAYTATPVSYEEKQAQSILQTITSNQYDFVLDMHTTTSIQQPCFITGDISETRKGFMRSSNIQHVVVLPKDIARVSLIGAITNSLAVEVSIHDITDDFLVSLAQDVERYLTSASAQNADKKVLYVSNPLYKTEMSEQEALQLTNFALNSYGFYPILVGEASYLKYKDYYGYKADSMEKITL